MTEGDTVTAYTYDKANRLTGETSGDYKHRYTYDKNGNMICRVTDRYTDASVSSGEELRIGVLGTSNQATQNIKNSYAVYCTYDEVNALTDVQSDDGMVASYVYNADGRRIQKTVNGVTTTHMWERDCIIGEKNANGDIMATYYRAAHLVASKQGDTVSTYSYDPHGSVVDFGGTSYQYDAFGNQLTDTTADNPFRYCGEYFDSETGFIYLRNRYYDTVTGRFITEDPVKDGLNWYVYCGNNPVMFVDPSGLLSYIIYDVNGISGDGKHTFADEANVRKGQLEERWGTEVYLLPVANAKEFENVWNYRVGYDWDGYDVPIEEVVIIAHGSIEGYKITETAQGYFYFGHKESKVYAKSNYDGDDDNVVVSDLAWKQMNYLNFSTCNSGNKDVYNLAYAFKQRMTVKQYIIAWDGGTIFNYNTGQLEAGAYDGLHKEPRRQTTWYKYVQKDGFGMHRRARLGFRQIKGE